MEEILVKTFAKINLSIDVKGRLDNGYHEVEMIMQSVGLFDTVTVEKTKSRISVRCAQPYVPNDRRNIAWKAAELFFSESRIKGGAGITIKKNIPVAAGLAGGSTNAVGVLKALNNLYGKPLDNNAIYSICQRLGADVPFFIAGGTQLAGGIGDKLSVLPDFDGVSIVLVKPPFPVSTPWVYKNLKLGNLGQRPDTKGLIRAIKEYDITFVANNMRNVLESVTVKEYPELQLIMERFRSLGALGTRMSGSGPTVFGIFTDEKQAEKAEEFFLSHYKEVYHVRTIRREEV